MAIYLKRWRRINAQAESFAQLSGDDASDDGLGNTNDNGHLYSGNQSTTQEDSSQNVLCEDDYQFEQQLPVLSSSDDDTDGFISLSSDDGDNNTFSQQLAGWASRSQCRRASLGELLGILRKEGLRVPKDPRTLLQTPTSVDTLQKCGGSYLYFGLESGILKLIAKHPSSFKDVTDLRLNFNIDGIPLFKSSNVQLWPILCNVNNMETIIVAIFCGNSKPSSVEEYLEDFVEELGPLTRNGISHDERNFAVKVNAFVCDAPARAFLKCIRGHTGYHSCERCTIKGSWEGRVVFHVQANDYEPRTNEEFARLRYIDQHQTKKSPLIELNIKCVSSFPLDYMHLVCLGVVKRMLMFLKQGPRCCRLSGQQIEQISDRLVSLNGRMPRDFARQPRPLDVLDRWKATELRQFLLYTGPLVLKGILRTRPYNHFLSLTVSMSILLDSNHETRNTYIHYARDLLRHFVIEAKQTYGDIFTSYNVHSLLHLADDAENYNVSLNELSAFGFENFLQNLKKTVRKAQNPVVQIAKRLNELERVKCMPRKKSTSPFISTKKKDGCLLLNDLSYAFVKEKRRDGNLECRVIMPERLDNFFEVPCESKLINIALLKDSDFRRYSRDKIIKYSDISRKLVCLPIFGDARQYLLIPMLHGIERK